MSAGVDVSAAWAARRSPLVVALAVVLLLAIAPLAGASFLTGTSAAHTLETATLEPPTALSGVSGPCLLGGSSISLTWVATTSTWAEGYEIDIATTSGGAPFERHILADPLATSHSIGGLSASTTYYVTMRAYMGSWRSVDTPEISVTTDELLCL